MKESIESGDKLKYIESVIGMSIEELATHLLKTCGKFIDEDYVKFSLVEVDHWVDHILPQNSFSILAMEYRDAMEKAHDPQAIFVSSGKF